MKSYFLEFTSSGVNDFVAMDFSGARQVVLSVTSANQDLDGRIVNEPFTNSQGLSLGSSTQPLVVTSTDDRLYWVSNGGFNAILQVWMVMA